MNQKYAILLWKCLKATADAAGIETPKNAELKSWKIKGKKPEDLIYSALLSGDSAEIIKKYGHATLDSAHYEDGYGGQSHSHVLWYHGERADMGRFNYARLLKVVGDGAEAAANRRKLRGENGNGE